MSPENMNVNFQSKFCLSDLRVTVNVISLEMEASDLLRVGGDFMEKLNTKCFQ